MRSNKAFTLIELLVVVAIIAILASILMPVFVQAKLAAKKSVCLSKHRNVSLAILLYTEGWNEVFPGYVEDTFHLAGDSTPIWTSMIQPYLKSGGVFTCPISKNSGFGPDWGRRGIVSIGINGNFGNWLQNGLPVRVRESQMDKPDRNVLLADATSGPTSDGYRGYVSNVWNVRNGTCGSPIVVNGIGSTVSDRHEKGAIITYADAHTQWYPISKLLPNGNPAPTDWCQCVADVNPAKAKWLVNWQCKTD